MKKIKLFLLSFKAICLLLAVVCIVLMVFNLYIMKETSIYVFEGYEKDVTILDGTIFTSIRLNRLASPTIIYNGEDLTLSEYTIGYYIDAIPISIISSENNGLTDVSLKEILSNSEFSFTESHSNAKYLSHENLKNITQMIFKIKAKSNQNKEINIEVPLDVTKIS